MIGRREADPCFEGRGHLRVVVLPGVDEDAVAAQEGGDTAQFHCLGAGAVDDGNP
jgi:hypothetical protein